MSRCADTGSLAVRKLTCAHRDRRTGCLSFREEASGRVLRIRRRPGLVSPVRAENRRPAMYRRDPCVLLSKLGKFMARLSLVACEGGWRPQIATHILHCSPNVKYMPRGRHCHRPVVCLYPWRWSRDAEAREVGLSMQSINAERKSRIGTPKLKEPMGHGIHGRNRTRRESCPLFAARTVDPSVRAVRSPQGVLVSDISKGGLDEDGACALSRRWREAFGIASGVCGMRECVVS